MIVTILFSFKESDMKTLFFSAIEGSNTDIAITREDGGNVSNIAAFNTRYILNPHDVLSAIKVRFNYI